MTSATTASTPQQQTLHPCSTDVVIVGFGPAGATLANLLGQYGVSTVVIDKEKQVLMMPRAIALDNEALRILQMAGLPEQAFEKIAIPQVRLRSHASGEFGRVKTVGCLDGHPKLVTFYQPDMEHALRQAVQQYQQVHCLLGHTVIDVVDHGDRVSVQYADRQGIAHQVMCRYLVAVDGASSPIRTRLGIEFSGETYPQDWLIVDARQVRQPISDIEFTCDAKRPIPHMTAPGGRERWEFMMKPDETCEQVLKPEFIQALLKPWANPEDLEIERTAVYRFHARVAKQFRRGNVFLVGDAAHITPPFVGQGLCAGLRDVANLGWKLAWVIHERAAPSILDSYDQERRPHARAMIDFARAMGVLIKPIHPWAGMMSSQVVKQLRRAPVVQSLIDDLKIKPKNRFKSGLFVPRQSHDQLDHGNHVRQALVKNQQGQAVWSDEILAHQLCLIGFGTNPLEHLSDQQAKQWLHHGGRFVQICHRGQAASTDPRLQVWEDLNGEFLPHISVGRVAVVRPDRVVMHDGDVLNSRKIIEKSLNMLGQEVVA